LGRQEELAMRNVQQKIKKRDSSGVSPQKDGGKRHPERGIRKMTFDGRLTGAKVVSLGGRGARGFFLTQG